ncbi:hypothetical protein [uncultured Algoriphagus sp.]|uniref:hypothetical protein n=1 Tax=uncultured Algoriphagus sp. TaxID=417365 RepID=UPI002588B4BF|nr:hypothetical protein [uncultured Algoriphagus sp.]
MLHRIQVDVFDQGIGIVILLPLVGQLQPGTAYLTDTLRSLLDIRVRHKREAERPVLLGQVLHFIDRLIYGLLAHTPNIGGASGRGKDRKNGFSTYI